MRLEQVPVISNRHFPRVMAVPELDRGIVPATYALLDERSKKDVDDRDNPRIKPGDRHDGPFVGMVKSSFRCDPATSRGIHAFLARLRH